MFFSNVYQVSWHGRSFEHSPERSRGLQKSGGTFKPLGKPFKVVGHVIRPNSQPVGFSVLEGINYIPLRVIVGSIVSKQTSRIARVNNPAVSVGPWRDFWKIPDT